MLLPRTTRRREKYNLFYNVGNTASIKDANESDIYIYIYASVHNKLPKALRRRATCTGGC